MASIKSDAVTKKRAMLNTTIDEKVLNEFKDYCKELGFPMNIVLEAFMRQFADGSFTLKIAKNKLSVDLEDE
jgi:antitoxin component of RelBE/YafQ-DinJ toxin-antitoxin module